MSRSTKTFPARAGLGLLEIVGCLVAMAIGIWLGAQYLGVDLNGAAYKALDETELLTKLPEEWRPVNPECPDGDCPDPQEVRLVEAAMLQQELDDLRFEVARLRAPHTGKQSTPAPSEALLSAEEQRVRTLSTAYWQRLAEIVAELDHIEQHTQGLLGSDEHARVLAVRRRSYDYGARAIRHLDPAGVDERALEVGVRVSEWCEHGAQMLVDSADLAGRQAVDGRSVRAEQVWAQSKQEHEMLTDLVRRKSLDTLVYLNGKYFVELLELPL
ncbi:hypothetical protein [Botrimarina hoheduenensis]|uniref:Uncharacterized protein n=1 Tax=Botrimarina hoheduenensis TaxID=2528000 RepID=A0A5C5WFL4_9BACT|nr:hypothetical protein [Botrimarina hoheduenensis]TWT48552.1 hypothetical protein Pla111_03250 [Botrimarina hoheduenensis]